MAVPFTRSGSRAYRVESPRTPPRRPSMSRLSTTNQPAPGADGAKRSALKPWTGVWARAASATSSPPRSQGRDVLELRMDPRSQDHHRPAAVGVVAGVPDQLEVAGQPDRLEEIDAVERLEHAL